MFKEAQPLAPQVGQGARFLPIYITFFVIFQLLRPILELLDVQTR